MTKFRDMQEQGTFHEGREYERKIQAKRIKDLEAHLVNINNCVAIIANNEVARTSKDLSEELANLEKYIEDALRG